MGTKVKGNNSTYRTIILTGVSFLGVKMLQIAHFCDFTHFLTN